MEWFFDNMKATPWLMNDPAVISLLLEKDEEMDMLPGIYRSKITHVIAVFKVGEDGFLIQMLGEELATFMRKYH
jgi:hypothetical protein